MEKRGTNKVSDILVSSDEEGVPAKRTRSSRNKVKQAQYIALSSDEEDSPSSSKIKKEKMMGEISLLTSDEDFVPDTPPMKKKRVLQRTKKAETKPKIKTIDLLTSDEEIDKPSVSNAKKRKASLEPLPEIAVKKRKSSIKVTPNTSLDITIDDINPLWDESQLLAEKTQIDEEIARNLIKLWEEGNTIPFIARYRKNAIGNMSAEDLRQTKEVHEEIVVLKKKMCTVVKTVATLGKLDEKLQTNIYSAKTLEELDHIYAPFKPDQKKSLAERARKLGLEKPALEILNNSTPIKPESLVQPKVKELETSELVEKGLMHILASEISTDAELLTFLRELRVKTRFVLHSKKAIKRATTKEPKKKVPAVDESKFQTYFDYSQAVNYLKSHQILAINRGESLKILTVKIEIPEFFEKQYKYFCIKKWTNLSRDAKRQEIVNAAIEDAYQRLISALIIRETRAELKQKAEKESCKVFSDNLKHLLLQPPMRGKSILGIDPGFANGCKLALISATGELLAQNVVYPHHSRNGYRGEKVIKDMLVEHRCNLIAIGNGTACRETEEWIANLIRTKYFDNLDVQYTIVNEDGASIYSCSAEAKKEFGNMDPNIISAASLARRIQDPMAELVKVEPCHLGIGMYQLDIKKKQLEEALSEVVSECVSFVGVDLNTASQCLLRRVAGLSDKKATQIIDHRTRSGPFTHRRQLLEVYGIGERVFEQCAGFLRIKPTSLQETNFYYQKNTTPLDATIIHPESYPTVRKLLTEMKLKEQNIGSAQFIQDFIRESSNLSRESLATKYKTDLETINLIFTALSTSLNHDLRNEVSKTPLFKKDVMSMEDLTVGVVLTGRVKNVTSFGAFVDLGVKTNGLLHNSKMRGVQVHLGDVLEVIVKEVDGARGRIQLEMVKKVN